MRIIKILAIVVCVCNIAVCKDTPGQILNWPNDETPLLRFTVQKIKEMPSYNGQKSYVIETSIENLTQKRIPKATFSLYLIDKKNVRIGDGFLMFEDLGPGQSMRLSVSAFTTGVPANIALTAKELPAELGAFVPIKKVSLTVYSVPSGANLKVDGKDAGVTPTAISIPAGNHMLEFSKEGFSNGTFPLVITADQLSGGSISYELGASAHDSIELRDGTLLNADVESVSASEVVVRLGGALQTFNRNQVKRIGFTVRQ